MPKACYVPRRTYPDYETPNQRQNRLDALERAAVREQARQAAIREAENEAVERIRENERLGMSEALRSL